MSSQKSIAEKATSATTRPAEARPLEARTPTRARGKARVAGLLDAAAEIIAERGYGAATMTEIAARAGAAIGSLYQFFPSKELLADALLRRYGERMQAALEALLKRASGATPCDMAAGLVAIMVDLKADRAAAIALLDSRDDSQGSRAELRDIMLTRLQALLAIVRPDVKADQAAVMSVMILYVLKSVPGLLADNGMRMRAEAERTLAAYIASSTI